MKGLPTELPSLTKAARVFAAAHEIAAAPFDLDMATGTATLHLSGRHVTRKAQVAGTYAGDGMFVWGWAHPSVSDPMRNAAARLHAYARAHQMASLLDRKSPATPLRARDYGAMVALVDGADAMFAGDYGDGTVYLALYEELS